MFKLFIKLIITVILIVSPLVSFAKNAPDSSVIVQKIVDGDTIKVIYQSKLESVRLIGIDTPESKINKRAYL